MGNAALPGLALLESGVEPTDPLIQNVAKRVRDLARRSQATYEISLAILFLDRLADPADGPMIRSLAARLIAGQSARAGWTYQCRLADDLETPLLTALDKMRPQMSFDKPLAREAGNGLLELKMPLAGPASDRAKPLGPPAAKSPVMPPAEVKMAMAFERPEEVVRLVRELPEALRHLPVFETPEGLTPVPKGKGKNRNGDGNDDNSNTQFAMLGLWTAHRHGVPVERSLLLADQRFAKSQQTGGGWGYQFGDEHAKASMTCVGLLGLAVGHGAMLGADKKASGGIGDDPAIRKGLTAVSRSVGSPNDLDEGKLDLYTLWSIERVGVLYGLTTIGGKDWYGWGANRILRAQNANGSWHGNGYHGSTTSLDTAFALLFLRRSNLVQDLTDRLQLHMPLRASP